MKKIAKRLRSFFEQQLNTLWNFVFVTFPMVYILYTYWISFHGHNPVQAAGGLLVTFGAFAYVHAKYMRKDHYAAKLRLQVMLANIALEVTMFAIAMVSENYHVSDFIISAASMIAVILGTFVVFYLLFADYCEEDIYKLFSTIFLILFALFFIYQVAILWMTWYVFVPALTGTIMISTIYRNGIVHEKSLPFMIFFTVPIMFGLGLISLFLQYFYFKIFGIELWKIMSAAALAILAMWCWTEAESRTRKAHAEIDGKEAVR